MFLLTSLIRSPIRSHFYAPRSLASLWSGLAAFSSTRHAAITRPAPERESEEARAAEARRREYQREWHRAARAKETEEERHERLARRRQKYASSPEMRKRRSEYHFEHRRDPESQAKQAEYNRVHRLKDPYKRILHLRQVRAGDLKLRRADGLASFLGQSKRWVQENWSWPTHQVVRTAARVDRHCTSCDKIRRLKLWWKEKHPPQRLNTESPQDRFMCNYCFANSWDLVVPEGNIEKLPPLLTSPDHPPPARPKDTNKAHQKDQDATQE
ncbi:hypothetical protein KCU92_g9025, partial [Aureobasidium melanogenum]